jgi:hypothetical protein
MLKRRWRIARFNRKDHKERKVFGGNRIPCGLCVLAAVALVAPLAFTGMQHALLATEEGA